MLDQESLEDVGDIVGESAADRNLAFEEREALANLRAEFVVGKPDEIFEPGGYHFVSVGDFDLEPGAGRCVVVAVGDVGEQAQVAELLNGSLEVLFGSAGSGFETSGGSDLFGGVPPGSGDMDGGQLLLGGGRLGRRLVCGLREAGEA